MSRPVGLRALAAAAVAAVLLGLPTGASAHATLEGTQPAQGATVPRNPGQVVFKFDETVEGNFGAVRVFDTRGARVDSGDGFHPNGTGSLIGVHLRPGLARGTYTATYRVVSADGHIVTGGFVFSIGRPGTGGPTVAQLLGRGTPGSTTTVAFAEARAVQYGAIALAVGGLVFLLGIWLPVLRSQAGGSAAWRDASDAFVMRLRVGLLMSALLGATSALAGVVFEAAEAAGVSGWAALAPNILRDELGTRFGTIWAAAAACWLAVGVLTTALLRPGSLRAPVLRPVPLGSTGLALPTAGSASGGRIGHSAGGPPPASGALRPRRDSGPGLGDVPVDRDPRDRRLGLARRSRHAALRPPRGDPLPGRGRANPPADGRGRPLLGRRPRRGDRAAGERPRPVLRRGPPSRPAGDHGLRPGRA